MLNLTLISRQIGLTRMGRHFSTHLNLPLIMPTRPIMDLSLSSIADNLFGNSRPKLQYISDLHVDTLEIGTIPTIKPKAEYLAICGDLGLPNHPNFELLLAQVSQNFSQVFFVSGNHEYGLSPLYKKSNIITYNPIIKKVCSQFSNIHFLNKETYMLSSKDLILGTTLWSRPELNFPSKSETYLNHLNEHQSHVNWLQGMIKFYQNRNLYILTHNLPSFQLIEPKYAKLGLKNTSWFATNLEHLMLPNVNAWLCGHSHSVVNCQIKDTYCGLNAYGYQTAIYGMLPQPKIRTLTID